MSGGQHPGDRKSQVISGESVGLAGAHYFAGALVLGLFYLASSVRFWSEVTDLTARRLLRASFVYLPAILVLLLLNPMPA